MRRSVILMIACIAFISFNSVPPADSIKKFEWLKGVWMMKKKNGGAIMESWIRSNDSTLNGESVNISLTGISRVMESLELAHRNGGYYYISAVKGQNNNQAVSFKLTSYSDSGFVAENPQHDFPKRISYRLVNKDSIHAFIDGGPAMPEKKSNFHYSRIKD